KRTRDVIPHAHGGTAGGSLAWNADGSGFWFTRYPHEGEKPKEELDFWQQVWFHKLGNANDTYELGKELPRIAEIQLQSSEDGKHLFALVSNGDGGDRALWVRASGGWTQVSKFEDGVIAARYGRDGGLWLLSKHEAPKRKVLRLAADAPVLAQA